jgi:peroxiredoxin Q/BCP
MLAEGSTAPEFEARLDNGEPFRLADYRGQKNVVLYFYPKDFTLGCTREACAFRDNYAELEEYDAVIVGVSSDSVDSHKRFREHHHLPFPLIADPDKDVIRLYDAVGFLGFTTARITYVIDKQGTIAAAMRHGFAISRHLTDVIDALRSLQAATP